MCRSQTSFTYLRLGIFSTINCSLLLYFYGKLVIGILLNHTTCCMILFQNECRIETAITNIQWRLHYWWSRDVMLVPNIFLVRFILFSTRRFKYLMFSVLFCFPFRFPFHVFCNTPNLKPLTWRQTQLVFKALRGSKTCVWIARLWR